MTLSAPVAYVSNSREVLVLDRKGHTHSQTLEMEGPLIWGSWQLGEPRAATFSWPTWSPDGQHLACFRLPGEGIESASVFVHQVGGIGSTELTNLGGRLPIYLHWAPDSRRIAVLSQHKDKLHLSTTALDDIGHDVTLAEGSPLFFTWTGHDVAAFVGDVAGGSSLTVIDPTGSRPAVRLPGQPGNFCAPLWLDNKVVYVLQEQGHTLVVASHPDTQMTEHVEEVSGLVALIASPDGKTMARAVAPGGDGTPYRQIGLVDVATGEVREVVDMPCLAYFWSPVGDRLVVARVDTARNVLEWLWLGLDGRIEHLCDMYPTRDFGFYLRFFEQYSQSHPLVDPDGRHLLLAGTMVQHPDRDTPRVWQVSLDTGAVEALAEGLFAVYGPTAAPV